MDIFLAWMAPLLAFLDGFKELLREYLHLLLVPALGWMAFSAWRRKNRPAWHPPIAERDILFHTEMASFPKRDTALAVTVTSDAILIEPSGAYKWFFRGTDDEFYIQRSDLLRAEAVSHRWRKGVALEFRTSSGGRRELTLLLKDREQLIDSLRPTRRTRPEHPGSKDVLLSRSRRRSNVR
jgi:hypothetical protein